MLRSIVVGKVDGLFDSRDLDDVALGDRLADDIDTLQCKSLLLDFLFDSGEVVSL